jgi:hypothetical protein
LHKDVSSREQWLTEGDDVSWTLGSGEAAPKCDPTAHWWIAIAEQSLGKEVPGWVANQPTLDGQTLDVSTMLPAAIYQVVQAGGDNGEVGRTGGKHPVQLLLLSVAECLGKLATCSTTLLQVQQATQPRCSWG